MLRLPGLQQSRAAATKRIYYSDRINIACFTLNITHVKVKTKTLCCQRTSEIKYRPLENIVISDNGDYCSEIVQDVLLHFASMDSSSFFEFLNTHL